MTRRTLVLVAGCTLLLAAGPFLVDAYWLRILTSVFMFGIVTQGLNIIVGLTGYHAFGNAAFFGIGAYATGVAMQLGLPFPLALATAPPACAAVAAILGWPILRLRGHYFAIATVALNLAMIELIPAIGGVTGGAEGLSLPLSDWEPGPLYIALYWTMLGGLCAATALVALLLRTRLGYALRAIRDSERAAAVVGIDTRRAKVAAWALSAAVTGFAGGVWAYWITFIEPGSAFDPAIGVRAYIMLILGGMGTVLGPVFGAFFLELLSTLIWANMLRGHQLVLGVLIVVVCLAAPNGLAEAVRQAARRLRMRSRGEYAA
jgi:branched-chain amino acid transport system permease protein